MPCFLHSSLKTGKHFALIARSVAYAAIFDRHVDKPQSILADGGIFDASKRASNGSERRKPPFG
jgi:hypothetical protein